jgi:putative spermidine/putrescine transport system ATP-binding protein
VEDGTVGVLGSRLPLFDGSAGSGEVRVFVRPEAVEVTPDQDGNGRVAAASFLGSLCRVQVRLADDTLVLAQVASAEVAHLAPGTPVRVTVRAVPVLTAPL